MMNGLGVGLSPFGWKENDIRMVYDIWNLKGMLLSVHIQAK